MEKIRGFIEELSSQAAKYNETVTPWGLDKVIPEIGYVSYYYSGTVQALHDKLVLCQRSKTVSEAKNAVQEAFELCQEHGKACAQLYSAIQSSHVWLWERNYMFTTEQTVFIMTL